MLNLQEKPGKLFVGYRDLTGGLNTKKDSHALARNQLQLSQNGWYNTGNSWSTRPGNTNMCSGATGSGNPCQGMAAGRFANVTTLLVQTGTTDLRFAKVTDANFTNITTAMAAGSGSISCAQMYDPTSAKTQMFICNGKDIPWMWPGPGNTTLTAVSTGATFLPSNHSGAAPITPKYVATLGSTPILFYAGEPTEPNAVYISDAFFPQSFTRFAFTQPGVTSSNFNATLIGFNDGIAGGDITGIAALNNAMLIYKQSAIYRLDFGVAVYGTINYGVSLVSASVGMLSPRSLAKFDGFHVFLGIDGVYQTDGYSTRRISDNVPTFFDGPTAAITDWTTAVGVRYGTRYLIFYDNAGAGSAQVGMWFDFSVLDEQGLPTAGEILGMTVGGVAEMRGPGDTGTFAWCNNNADQVGQFGIGSTDFGNAITRSFTLKSDWFDEFFDPGAPTKPKVITDVTLLLAIPQASFAQSLTFNVSVTSNLVSSAASSGATFIVPGSGGGAIVGSAIVGTAVISALSSASNYQPIRVNAPYPAKGEVLSISVSETSAFAWSCLGVEVLVNKQERAA